MSVKCKDLGSEKTVARKQKSEQVAQKMIAENNHLLPKFDVTRHLCSLSIREVICRMVVTN